MEGRNLMTLIENGGAAMWPLLLCSIVSIAVILERTWTILRAARASAHLNRLVREALDGGNFADASALSRRDPSPLGGIFKAILAAANESEDTRDRAMARRQAEAIRSLKRFVWLLGTIGSLAPFIGLFGTVVGIMRAFESMAATGSGGFAVVAAGISEALIATAAGLFVGVLSIFAYNALTVRINNLGAQWREWSDDLVAALKPRAREGSVARVAQSR